MGRSDAKRFLAEYRVWIVLPPMVVAVLAIAVAELAASRTPRSRGGVYWHHELC
ncbi:MAG: hypothetical protein HZA52_05060 [Planctomycetes bacterium]|nr:hypothetical protein [Planctomycetota bacterium]